jgi:hypothetical protein
MEVYNKYLANRYRQSTSVLRDFFAMRYKWDDSFKNIILIWTIIYWGMGMEWWNFLLNKF